MTPQPPAPRRGRQNNSCRLAQEFSHLTCVTGGPTGGGGRVSFNAGLHQSSSRTRFTSPKMRANRACITCVDTLPALLAARIVPDSMRPGDLVEETIQQTDDASDSGDMLYLLDALSLHQQRQFNAPGHDPASTE